MMVLISVILLAGNEARVGFGGTLPGGIGNTSKATDWAPEVGLMFSFGGD